MRVLAVHEDVDNRAQVQSRFRANAGAGDVCFTFRNMSDLASRLGSALARHEACERVRVIIHGDDVSGTGSELSTARGALQKFERHEVLVRGALVAKQQFLSALKAAFPCATILVNRDGAETIIQEGRGKAEEREHHRRQKDREDEWRPQRVSDRDGGWIIRDAVDR